MNTIPVRTNWARSLWSAIVAAFKWAIAPIDEDEPRDSFGDDGLSAAEELHDILARTSQPRISVSRYGGCLFVKLRGGAATGAGKDIIDAGEFRGLRVIVED